MLIQFNFKNFKSFRDDTSLDMTATSITEHPYNLINSGDEKYIKTAAIYGANASGKSSVIEAYTFMRNWIRDSFKQASTTEDIPIKRFAFDSEALKEPAEFEVFFKYNNHEYQYGFSLDNKKILEEWLYVKKDDSKNKYITLFERADGRIDCNSKLLHGAENFISMVEDKTLFLSIISNAKISYVKDVIDFFLIPVIDYGNINFEKALTELSSTTIENKFYQRELVKFLNAVDINIDDIIIEKVKNENDETKIYTKHLMNDKVNYYKMPISEESSGTQKMFSLFYYLQSSLELGLPIFIDELDAKLHPLLLRYILTMFHDENINRNGAQLIYVTHDNYTLTKDIFRRDQIWFVEKDSDAVSHLYSLAEYKSEDDKKVRKDASYNKDYLLGKYGSVPILRGYDMWRNQDAEIK
ncbi:AAA family ATPase [Clostridium beijerinckii]|uniref:AAA family ATPase n=1 Tax=Clostridium beijerinckii TaxID=1520 RepID=UPI00136175F6|nr:ATP-binding protein [Clostridium beijerinckii]MZK53622.1 AAA family ATPase [Clostridium beijerinckii]MZK61727.1 AAA family ATPase [Clostridium beijerinckii]MZK71459.1 AAA family ATPase [Clostridium beijerinckii]MZK76818.1 AAA family ATPase [Clostridium beijerinckii]MZK85556.1 AAA family ATPase [Clostridium beijerinckii]